VIPGRHRGQKGDEFRNDCRCDRAGADAVIESQNVGFSVCDSQEVMFSLAFLQLSMTVGQFYFFVAQVFNLCLGFPKKGTG